MATLTLGTFNLNNLFDRWNFAGALEALQQGVRTVDATFVFDDPQRRRLQLDSTGKLLVPKPAADTARIAERIVEADVDVWVVQEVENREALAEFNRAHLGSAYPYSVVVDGNDALRFIDVGILSRHPLGAVTTWQKAVHPDQPDELVFSRDLLEVEILNEDRSRRLLTVFATHLKSKFVPWDSDHPDRDRAAADDLRRRQAETAVRIIGQRTTSRSRYALLGDMNDSPDSGPLAPLRTSPDLVDGLADPAEVGTLTTRATPPTTKRWTSTHKDAGKPRTYDLIDQIWLSPALAERHDGAWIGRRTKLERDGSDHDPAWVRLRL
jgi:exonuclease III